MTLVADPPVPAVVPEDRPHTGIDLMLISFGLLFMEQACIRWVSSHMRLLAYFSNFILLACFVGMGLGLLRAGRRTLLPLTLPLLLLLCGLMASLDLSIVVSRQELSQAVYFGAESVSQKSVQAPLWVVLALAFLFIASLFIGPGQAIGAAFRKLAPLEAYGWNIGGSLLGVAAFMGVSALSLSPAWWWGIGGVVILWLLRGNRPMLVLSALCLAGTVALVAHLEADAIWSPYNRIRLVQKETRGHTATALIANNLTHQEMQAVNSPGGAFYDFPYLLNRLGRGIDTPGKVLVIGAGTGNDLSHALAFGATHVDAVDIDPRIQQIGREHHPMRPYSDPRVTGYVNDGRAFLRQTQEKYDFVIYGVVDSLSLLSQFGAVRLENFLFTEEAYRDVKAHLAPKGIFAIYNFFRQGWLATRIYRSLQRVFGEANVVMVVFPPQPVFDENRDDVSLVLFLSGDVAQIRELLDSGRMQLQISPWMREAPSDPGPAQVPFVAVREVRHGEMIFPTDDWPFPYMRWRQVPAHLLMSVATILGTSMILLFGFGGVKPRLIRPHFFLLGAAFMLIETEGIARLALLFGSTWINNSLTFLGILAISLLSNLVAARRENLPYAPLYAGLFLSLLLAFAVPLDALLTLPAAGRAACGLVLLFLPIFFSGLIFSRSLRDSARADQDLGANVLGAVVGGCLENLSVVLGFRVLLLVIVAIYAASLVGLKGRQN